MPSVHRPVRSAFLALLAASSIGLLGGSVEVLADASISDGVYSEAQAQRGAESYVEACGRCHKDDLMGGLMEPPLAGEEFLSKWGGKTVGSLFEEIHLNMPSNEDKGTLPPALIADVIAYMFKQNGFPAGETELPVDIDVLQTIRIDPAN
jgi:mono/diheme cytochrome c family protein